jgi:hypothetical protein
MAVTIRTICTDAAKELEAIGAGETLSADDASTFLGLLRRLLNLWNADRRAVYATAFAEFTLVANLSPHTIGPTGATFTVTQRPVSLEGANLVLNLTTPNVNTPIHVRDAQWWLRQSVPDLTSTYPTDVYYQPDWPNGKLFFWPVPTAAYDVQLMTRVLLSDTVDLNDSFSLPPGYQDAITLTLAEMSRRTFSRPVDPTLVRDASIARAAIFGNNDVIPRLTTRDAGMTPGRGGTRADFNWLNGQIT